LSPKYELDRRIGGNSPSPNFEEQTTWILNGTRTWQWETAELIGSVPGK